jgi:hypothetical protein
VTTVPVAPGATIGTFISKSCWFALTRSPLRYPRRSLDRHVSRCPRTAPHDRPRIPGNSFRHETEGRNAFTCMRASSSTRSTAETTLRRSLRRLARRPPVRRRRDGHEPTTRRGLVEPSQGAISQGSADLSAGLYGHCPLFTHPAAGWAFTVGAANDVAIVAAGGSKVAVAPMLISVGSTFMAGTVGDA